MRTGTSDIGPPRNSRSPLKVGGREGGRGPRGRKTGMTDPAPLLYADLTSYLCGPCVTERPLFEKSIGRLASCMCRGGKEKNKGVRVLTRTPSSLPSHPSPFLSPRPRSPPLSHAPSMLLQRPPITRGSRQQYLWNYKCRLFSHLLAGLWVCAKMICGWFVGGKQD